MGQTLMSPHQGCGAGMIMPKKLKSFAKLARLNFWL